MWKKISRGVLERVGQVTVNTTFFRLLHEKKKSAKGPRLNKKTENAQDYFYKDYYLLKRPVGAHYFRIWLQT